MHRIFTIVDIHYRQPSAYWEESK